MDKLNLQLRIPPKVESTPVLFSNEMTFLEEIRTEAFERLNRSLVYNCMLLASFLLAIGEPILVGLGSHGMIFSLQIAFLAASSGFFVVVLLLQSRYLISQDDFEEIQRSSLLFSLIEPDVVFEAACLSFGWATLFIRPGLAALRCIRVFRFCWYTHMYSKEGFNPSTDLFFGPRQVMVWIAVYLERLGAELFSSSSLGGVVVIALFLYISYLFAIVFWTEKNDILIEGSKDGNDCHSLNNCFITMLRLAFYDTNGFDYLQAMMNSGNHGYTFLLLLYVILAGIILLGGLIGIFSRVFAPIKSSSATVASYQQKTERTVSMRVASPRITGPSPNISFVRSAVPSTPAHGSQHSGANDSAEQIANLVEVIESLRLEVLTLNSKVSYMHELLLSRQPEAVAANNSPVSKATPVLSPAQREQKERQALERAMDRVSLLAKKMSARSFKYSGNDMDEDESDAKQDEQDVSEIKGAL